MFVYTFLRPRQSKPHQHPPPTYSNASFPQRNHTCKIEYRQSTNSKCVNNFPPGQNTNNSHNKLVLVNPEVAFVLSEDISKRPLQQRNLNSVYWLNVKTSHKNLF